MPTNILGNRKGLIEEGAKLEVMKHKILHFDSIWVDLLETKFKGEAYHRPFPLYHDSSLHAAP